jgi:hypothetical protein
LVFAFRIQSFATHSRSSVSNSNEAKAFPLCSHPQPSSSPFPLLLPLDRDSSRRTSPAKFATSAPPSSNHRRTHLLHLLLYPRNSPNAGATYHSVGDSRSCGRQCRSARPPPPFCSHGAEAAKERWVREETATRQSEHDEMASSSSSAAARHERDDSHGPACFGATASVLCPSCRCVRCCGRN